MTSLLVSKTSPGPQAKPLLQRVVLLYMPGLGHDLYTRNQDNVPVMTSLLGKPAIVIAKTAMVHTGILSSIPVAANEHLQYISLQWYYSAYMALMFTCACVHRVQDRY